MIRSQMIVWFLVCLLNVTRAGPAGRSERRQRLHALLCEVQSSGTQSSGKDLCANTRLTPDRIVLFGSSRIQKYNIIYIIKCIFILLKYFKYFYLLYDFLFQRLIEQVEQRSDRIPEWVMENVLILLFSDNSHFYAYTVESKRLRPYLKFRFFLFLHFNYIKQMDFWIRVIVIYIR